MSAKKCGGKDLARFPLSVNLTTVIGLLRLGSAARRPSWVRSLVCIG